MIWKDNYLIGLFSLLPLTAKLNDEADRNLKQLIASTLNTTVTWNRLAEMTDTFGHRLVGSPGLEKSIDWLVSLIQKDGIDVTTEPVKVNYWHRKHESLNLLTNTRGEVPLKVSALGDSASSPEGGITAEVVPVSSFDEMNTLLTQNKDIFKGKIVLYNFPFKSYGDGLKYRNQGAKKAEENSAVAAIIKSVAPFGLSNVHVGEQSIQSNIPSVAITMEDAGLLTRMYKRATGGIGLSVLDKDQISLPKVRLDIQIEFENNTKISRNVIAEIKGTEFPHEYIIFGGHIDSWDLGVGAMDDGGGSFTSYEALRQISKLPMKPKRTIQAVFWTSEENGGYGGVEFAKNRKDLFDKMAFVMESDYNSARANGISFRGNNKQEAFINETASTYLKPLGFGYNISKGYGGTDIDPICEDSKVPCASLDSSYPVKNTFYNASMGTSDEDIPSGYFWIHHSDADRMEVLKPEQLAKCSATMAAYVYAIAQNDEALHKMTED